METKEDALLAEKIENLELSDQFKRQCQKMDLKTIGEITATEPEALVRLPGFSYTWLSELSAFLLSNNKLQLLQPPAGKNYGRS